MSGLAFLSMSLIAEGFIVLIVAGLLTVMNRSLGYDYQKYWALSWFAFAAYLALTGITLFAHATPLDLKAWQLPVSAITQWFGYLKIYFLLVGTLVMCGKADPRLNVHGICLLVIAIWALTLVSILQEPNLRAERYFVRVGLRSFIVGFASVYCSYLIYTHVTDKTGAKVFAICLAMHGLLQQILFIQSINYLLYDIPLSNWISGFTLIDVPLQTFLAFSLVAWAIENEHEKVSETETKLKTMALHNALTGLPNRLWLEKYFSERIPQMINQDERAAFVFIDLDGFKSVNDSFGHRVGDLLLQEVSSRLAMAALEKDMICRFGGDEFVWVLPDSKNHLSVMERVEQFRRSIETIDSIENHPISISCSMGLSWYPQNGTDLETLTRHSDQALYEAKRQGKNRIVHCATDFE